MLLPNGVQNIRVYRCFSLASKQSLANLQIYLSYIHHSYMYMSHFIYTKSVLQNVLQSHLKNATKTHLCACFLSRLEYCNALLSSCPKHLTEKLQRLQNHMARLLFRSSKFDHVCPLLKCLHWLPVHSRIDYKLSSLCSKITESTAPSQLTDLLHLYTLCQLDDHVFCLPHVHTKAYGQRSFFYQGPFFIKYSESLLSFKSKFKPHLFPK